jgi:hypothetical protein
MHATDTILISLEAVTEGFGVATDKDEFLRQAIVVIAGEKHTGDMQWMNVEFTATARWLAERLEAFRKDEELVIEYFMSRANVVAVTVFSNCSKPEYLAELVARVATTSAVH